MGDNRSRDTHFDWVSETIGGVSPIGWINSADFTLIDVALSEYKEIWAAAGHPHAVFPTTFEALQSATNASHTVVGNS